ncbi:hypothetical protein BCR33DRAFT_747748 [Rhizoclosmatium globosum]|uniref:RRM domain-containing protein n=1 Tax=Rhizoclosmatium globosum TaxID=329046 RepID=A0A1Y2AQ92_9FUNG|nr:hypothetical protein BCR33DRAFT_747748 [Rhizoclosmatium globosum]|eukprot:ORY24749.1 hypothetical protein BCR33DRAFT_747748 [Rhizoclosmatium globosum]
MSGLGYMLPKDEQRLTERNYATHFLQWYTDLSNAVATLGIPQNALFYEGGTEPPYSKVVTKSVLFLSKQVECVPAAEVYGINADGTLKTPTLSQKKELFQLTAAYDTMKSRVTAAICHFTDPFMYAVYKQGAGNNEEIVAGMNALRSHCLVNNSANIDAAKNSLRALRLQPNEHPSQFLRNMKKRILELSELGYPSTTEADNFESENVRQFFAGMPTAEMQRSMKTLVASAKGKTDFTFRDIVDVMAEDERSIQQMNHHKEMFDKNTSKAFLSEAKNEAKFVTVDEFNNLATELAKALAAINKTSNNAAHPTANRTKDPLKVYVAGLPEGTTQAQLLGLFQTATEAFVVRNKTKNTTIGFVSFANPAAATLALSSVPELGGKKLTIQAAFNKAASHYKIGLIPI